METKLNILLRMNDVCESVSSPRVFGQKREIVKLCFDSLMKNIEEYGADSVNIQVFYNELSETMYQYVSKTIGEDRIHKVELNPNWAPNIPTLNAEYQCGRTLEGPVMLLEDDYYFYPGSLRKIMDFYEERKKEEEHVCINIMEDFNPSLDSVCEYVYKNGGVNWRKITHTTLSFLTDAYLLNKYEKYYMDYFNYFNRGFLPGTTEYVTEVNTINRVYAEINCYAPTPSLTEHLHNWQTISRTSPFMNVARGLTTKQIADIIEL